MFPCCIRLAQPEDIPILGGVERSAAAAFLALPNHTPSYRTVPEDMLTEMATGKKLWVATGDDDKIIGFVGCRCLDNILYVHEISVVYECQKQGVGRQLMLTVLNEAIKNEYAAVGLTTRRNAAWNMPFYKTLGFHELTEERECPVLWRQLQSEINHGADPSIRCAMILSCYTLKLGISPVS